MTRAEEWRAVAGYEGRYEVSSLGRIRRERWWGPKPMASCVTGGYGRVCLYRDKKPRVLTVHSLVAEAFIGPRPPGTVVNHIDGDKLNNASANLEYLTPAENSRHAAAAGRMRSRPGACGRCRQQGHNRGTCTSEVTS